MIAMNYAKKVLCGIAVLWVEMVIPQWSAVAQAESVVNPHWTGRHCAECHEEGRPPALRFGGDIHWICVRCHDRRTAQTFEPHPVNVPVPTDMQQRMPREWPLQNGTLTCSTCHDVMLQMYGNVAARIANPDFLRIRSQKQQRDVCFFCHDPNALKKHNPHTQVNADGSVDQQTCVVCHLSYPDPETVRNPAEAHLASESPLLCTGCHAAQQQNHPARIDHLVKPSAEIALALAKASGTFPLINGRVHCATCHNPHDKALLKNQQSAKAPYFLRAETPAHLCTACHAGMDATEQIAGGFEKNLLKRPSQSIIYHRPWKENKCKACHAVSREVREKPLAVYLCLKQGCHDATLVDKAFVHESSVLANCSFCHENHGSGYEKLLRTNQERICSTCHPLLYDPDTKRAAGHEALRSVHKKLMAYSLTAALEPGNECFFCHAPEHKARISALATGACADCHITVKNILREAAVEPAAAHDRFLSQRCTDCHDPHAGPYEYQLKEPRAAYGLKKNEK